MDAVESVKDSVVMNRLREMSFAHTITPQLEYRGPQVRSLCRGPRRGRPRRERGAKAPEAPEDETPVAQRAEDWARWRSRSGLRPPWRGWRNSGDQGEIEQSSFLGFFFPFFAFFLCCL